MGTRESKMKRCKSTKEVYNYGFDCGFGTCMGITLGYFKRKGLLEDKEFIEYVLKRKAERTR
jgi:hypothetical protein